MDIELYSVLAMVILIATIITIIFAVYSYLAFRFRQKRTPAADAVIRARAPQSPQFFKRYEPSR
jgi:heme/copper-type cytochrome/quinol oxidase subunit 2